MPELMTKSTSDTLEACQQALGYTFLKPELLRAALTHASGADSRLASNERLEFLGDAVLGLVVCERLFLNYPDLLEGDMTKIKSVVVSRRTCAHVCRQLNVEEFLFLGKGMNQAVPTNVLADLYESLVAAIYLDGGLEPAREFILKHLAPEIDQVAANAHMGNYKSVLQQLAQREYGATPNYQLLDEKGPDHSKCFKIAAVIGRHHFAAAWGRNKKEAEQKAALNAFHQINGQPAPYACD
jgi:ribonuclease-3